MIVVHQLSASNQFERELQRAPEDVQKAAREALNLLQANPGSGKLRLHHLSDYGKPMIWKIDVFTNHSWQITFELENDIAVLKRLGKHKSIDRSPR